MTLIAVLLTLPSVLLNLLSLSIALILSTLTSTVKITILCNVNINHLILQILMILAHHLVPPQFKIAYRQTLLSEESLTISSQVSM